MADDSELWYYHDGTNAQGPVALSTLRAWLTAGQISPELLVAPAGGSEWVAVSVATAPPQAAARPPLPALPAGLAGRVESPRRTDPAAAVRPKALAPTQAAPLAAAPSVPVSAEVAVELRCVAGPDTGRSFWIGPAVVVLDRQAGLVDPYLGEVQVVLARGAGVRVVRLRVASGHALVVAGQPVAEAELAAGERVQIGSSLWEVGTTPVKVGELLSSLGSRLNQLASVEKLEGFSLREMFSEVFTPRTAEQIDEYFLVGTTKTTPPLAEVATGWPKPWLFGRVLLFLAIVYFAFFVAVQQFGNPRLLPGLILMGSMAVPFATLILFYELNTPHNVSFRMVLTLFMLGGVVSLFVSLIGFSVANLSWLGASSAGIIEEVGKLATVILIVRGAKYRFISNGLLFGAAVGAGFAAFESAGYAFWDALMAEGSIEATVRLITLRALLSPFGHVAWTAIAAGALWRARAGRPFSLAMLGDSSFLRTLLIPVVLHMLWNSPIPSPLWSKHLLLGAIGWFIVFGLVQQGLRQIKQEQAEATRQQIESTRSFIRPAITG